MQVKLIEGADALVKFINGIAGRAKRLDSDLHIGAMSAAAHFEKHGDVTYINRLYLAMGKGARHTAMTEWMLQFAGVMANDGAAKKNTPFLKDPAKKVNLEQGAKKPWFLLKPSKAPDEVVDVYALTLAVIKKASADGKQIVHGEMVTELQALAAKYAPAEETADVGGDADPLSGASDE